MDLNGDTGGGIVFGLFNIDSTLNVVNRFKPDVMVDVWLGDNAVKLSDAAIV